MKKPIAFLFIIPYNQTCCWRKARKRSLTRRTKLFIEAKVQIKNGKERKQNEKNHRIYQICDQVLHGDQCKKSILPLRRSTIISEVTDILCGPCA